MPGDQESKAVPTDPPTAAAEPAPNAAPSTATASASASTTPDAAASSETTVAAAEPTAAASASSVATADAATAAALLPDPVKEKADKLKDLGNAQFMKENFNDAAEFYTAALTLRQDPIYLSNRAFCYLKTEAFGLARVDAKAAIKLNPRFAKAYYRLGSAHLALGRTKLALAVFKRLCLLAPKDKDARRKFDLCKKEVTRQKFEAAIATEQAPPLCDTLDTNNMVVPSSYTGPHLSEENDGEVTLEFVMELVKCFRSQQLLHRKYVIMMLIALEKQLRELPSLINVTVPEAHADGSKSIISVCGDTHGQFYDVLNIFEINGYPSDTNPYLFNGDFVDRGSFSVEVFLTFVALKLLYPEHMHLLRGNHETKMMNKIYGFEGEVKHKYDDVVMDLCTEVFNWLPLSAVINQKVIVMHGGLFQQDGVKLDDIRKISRNVGQPDSGLMSDILWSDPQPFMGRGESKRGVGQSFGPDITKAFLDDNGLELIVRSHEVREEGYLVEHDGKLITVFSAPNYCDQMGNKGALIKFDSECRREFLQFTASPHPPIRPMAYAANMNRFGL